MNSKNYLTILIFLLSIDIIFAQEKLTDSNSLALDRYMVSFESNHPAKKGCHSWLAMDKGRHLVASLYGTVLVGQISNRFSGTSKSDARLIAMGTIVSLGLIKEIYDGRKQDNRFSWPDMTSNMIGIMIGFLLLGIK